MIACKILIIDDDTDDVEILSDAFKSSGVEYVHYVHTAMEAFMFLEEQKNKESLPKLIVTDMYLPGMTGAEFLKDLKEMDNYKHIPIVVLSSTKSTYEIEKYKNLGNIDYVEKPSTYEEYKKVAAYINNKIEA
ncbi:MAG: response regulator [Chitinophagaceae bacterium]